MSANTKEKYDNETKNFETLKYNISDNSDILLDDSCDPDVNFFNKKISKSWHAIFNGWGIPQFSR